MYGLIPKAVRELPHVGRECREHAKEDVSLGDGAPWGLVGCVGFVYRIYYALFCRYTLTPLLAEFGPRDDFSDVGRDADRHLDERRDRWQRRLARLARTHEWTESVRGGRRRRRRARHARDALFLLRPDGVAGVASRNEAIQPRQLGERHHQGGMRGGSGRRRRWRDASASVRVGE